MLVELSLAAIIVTYGAILACRASGLVDRPDARKQHGGVVPLAGGTAIFATWVYAVLRLKLEPYSQGAVIVIGAVFALGLLDDRLHLKPGLRLLLHYGAGIAMATWAGVEILNVGNLLAMGDIPLLWLSVPLTALSFAGLANAYNMIDGIDGLAGAAVAVPLGVLLVLAYGAGHPMTLTLTAVLVPLAVYLCFNLGPDNRALPRIFLGDSGSVMLGFFVCASLVYFSQGEGALIEPVTALWLVTLPLMDMLATMLKRWREGRHPMGADRGHLHHGVMAMGLTARETLGALSAWSLLCALLGLALEAVPAYLSLLLYFVLFLAHCALALKMDRVAPALRERLGRTAVAAEP